MVSFTNFCFLTLAISILLFIVLKRRSGNAAHRTRLATLSTHQSKTEYPKSFCEKSTSDVSKGAKISKIMCSRTGTGERPTSPVHRELTADESELPPPSAAVSLEDLVRFRPGRGRTGKGTRWTNSIDFGSEEDVSKKDNKEHSEPIIHTIERQPRSLLLTQSFTPCGLEPQAQNAQAPLDLSQSSPFSINPPRSAKLTPNTRKPEDGDFHLNPLSDGNMSIYRWSEREYNWIPFAQIDQSDVSLFTRFYERSYADNRSNAEGWKLYKNHIAAFAKQLGSKTKKHSDLTGNSHNALPEPIYYPPSLKQSRSQEVSTTSYVPGPGGIESFPALPQRTSNALRASAPSLTMQSGTIMRDQYLADRPQTSLQIGFTHPKQIQSRAIPFPSNFNQNASPARELKGRDEYRELERRRLKFDDLLRRQIDTSVEESSANVRLANPSSQEQPKSLRSNQQFVEPATIRSAASSQDLRRTVLHDPLKARSVSLQQLQAELHKHHVVTVAKHTSSSNTNAYSIERYPDASNPYAQLGSNNALKNLVLNSEPDLLPRRPVDSTDKPESPFPLQSESIGLQNLSLKTSRERRGSLEGFWNSGRMRFNRQMAEVDKFIINSDEVVSKEAETGLRLLIPVFASLQEYQFSQLVQAAGGRDHFAPFVAPSGAEERRKTH